MKTLYLHIGTPKTGTKSIQWFCWKNRKLFKKHGYCYPDLSNLCPDFTVARNGHFMVDLMKTVEKEERKQAMHEKFEAGMKRVCELFEKYDNIVLSDENIWLTTYKKRKNLWKELKEVKERERFQIKIIVYLRRQDGYLSSSWNQVVKMGDRVNAVKSWTEYKANFPKNRQLNYYEKLETIAAELGKENIIVRRFERGKFSGGSIYSDFLETVGLELTDEYKIVKEVRNSSLKGNMPEIKRVLNNMPELDDNKNRFFRNVLIECSEISDGNQANEMFTRDELREFLNQYEESNRLVAREYLREEGTELFETEDLDKSDIQEAKPDIQEVDSDVQEVNPGMQEDMIRFVGLSCMRLMEKNQKLESEIQELKSLAQKKDNSLQRYAEKFRCSGRRIHQKLSFGR